MTSNILITSFLRKYLGLASVLLLSAAAVAQDRGDESTLALTFAYAPTFSAAELANGYRKHLEWHAARNDPILWYAWFVVEGERLGQFVDGAFALTGAEFDQRPDPAGDAADATENFVPYAQMQYRRVYRLRPQLGSSSFLEERNPSPMMQVVYYRVRPGAQMEFEAAVASIAGTARNRATPFAIYEMLTGAGGAMYAMYVPLEGFRGFDNPMVSLELVAQALLPAADAAAALERLAASVKSANAEVWQYRADLSLIPE